MFDSSETILLREHMPVRKTGIKRHKGKHEKRGKHPSSEEAVEKNLGLVHKIAADCSFLPLDYDDLVSEGSLGLIKAIDKFDPEIGASFSTYAAFWIKQGMRRASENQGGVIRIPVQSGEKIRKLKAARAEIKDFIGREPSYSELGGKLGWDEAEVKKISLLSISVASLNSPGWKDEGGAELQDCIADCSCWEPDKMLAEAERKEIIRKLVKSMNGRESKIISMYFGLDSGKPQTHEAISRKIGISRERVRQIQHESLRALKSLYKKYEIA